jgi:hypothetical protein
MAARDAGAVGAYRLSVADGYVSTLTIGIDDLAHADETEGTVFGQLLEAFGRRCEELPYLHTGVVVLKHLDLWLQQNPQLRMRGGGVSSFRAGSGDDDDMEDDFQRPEHHVTALSLSARLDRQECIMEMKVQMELVAEMRAASLKYPKLVFVGVCSVADPEVDLCPWFMRFVTEKVNLLALPNNLDFCASGKASSDVIQSVESSAGKPDIVGLEHVLEDLRLGLFPPALDYSTSMSPLVHSGVLLYGPPGTGKTLLAKYLAQSERIGFLAVNFSDVLKGYVGESERAIARLFAQAHSIKPCILFIDELQALFGKKSSGRASGAPGPSAMILSQLTSEMDRAWSMRKRHSRRSGVVVIAATNRPDLLDPSLLRSGRLERHIFVGLPSLESRRSLFLLNPFLRSCCLDDGLVEFLARESEGFSGADIVALCNLIGFHVISSLPADCPLDSPPLLAATVQDALDNFKPSVSKDTLVFLEKWRKGELQRSGLS